MAYRYGNRKQMTLLPGCIEEYVSKENPVRAYDAFVEGLDFKELGIEINENKVGNSEYNPSAMLKLLIYGYSYGIKSSRKLERAIHDNLTFIWLMEGLKPDHKTISEFRRKNKKALVNVLKQSVRMCMKFGLIDGNILFVDGTKIRANAGRSNNHGKGYYEAKYAVIDKRIDDLLEECESIDVQEEGESSYVKMQEELVNQEGLKKRMKEFIDELDSGGKRTVNSTDPDSRLMRSVQGSHASYNVQMVVDDKTGLIVHGEAVSETSDVKQFARQIELAEDTIGKKCEVGCADAGYANTEELGKIEERGETKVVVPSQRQALHGEEKLFSKKAFKYNREGDYYRCPEGKILKYSGVNHRDKKIAYIIGKVQDCLNCRRYGECTKSKRGRKIVRLMNEDIKEKLEKRYEEAEYQEIYRRRKLRVEHPFGHIKRNLKTDAFLLRGREGVQAETSLLMSCFNMSRLISIMGVVGLIARLGG